MADFSLRQYSGSVEALQSSLAVDMEEDTSAEGMAASAAGTAPAGVAAVATVEVTASWPHNCSL